jgi:hypothetical protein
MDQHARVRLQVVAAALALAVAAVHLLHPSQGGHAIVVYASVGQLSDPRPPLFALGSFALVFGVVLGYNGFSGRPLYLGGIVIASAFPIGYGAWHTVLDHGAFWPHLASNESHGGNPVAIVFEHLFGDALALVSGIGSIALVGCLLVLYHAAKPEPSE